MRVSRLPTVFITGESLQPGVCDTSKFFCEPSLGDSPVMNIPGSFILITVEESIMNTITPWLFKKFEILSRRVQ